MVKQSRCGHRVTVSKMMVIVSSSVDETKGASSVDDGKVTRGVVVSSSVDNRGGDPRGRSVIQRDERKG